MTRSRRKGLSADESIIYPWLLSFGGDPKDELTKHLSSANRVTSRESGTTNKKRIPGVTLLTIGFRPQTDYEEILTGLKLNHSALSGG